MSKKKEEWKEKINDTKETVEAYIEEHPKRCVVGAAVGGIFIGALISCLFCRRK